MIKCPKCNAMHPLNTFFCNECGEYLGSDSRNTTAIRFMDSDTDSVPVAEVEDRKPQTLEQPEISSKDASITLLIGESAQQLVVFLKDEMLLGRLDPINNNYPEVNLADYGGLEQGISRRHARILRKNDALVVEDLGSVNGSILNGTPLTPYLTCPLNSGDILQLGKLSIKIIF